MASLLVLDDDPDTCKLLQTALAKPGRDVRVANRPDDALESLKARPADVVITDYDLQSSRNGLDVLRFIKTEWPQTQVILMSGYSTLDSAVAGIIGRIRSRFILDIFNC